MTESHDGKPLDLQQVHLSGVEPRLLMSIELPSLQAHVSLEFALKAGKQSHVVELVAQLVKGITGELKDFLQFVDLDATEDKLKRLHDRAMRGLSSWNKKLRSADELWHRAESLTEKAKSTMNSMRDAYYKELMQLKEQLHRKHKREALGEDYQAAEVSIFDPTDYMFDDELGKIVRQKAALLQLKFEIKRREMAQKSQERVSAVSLRLSSTRMLVERKHMLLERKARLLERLMRYNGIRDEVSLEEILNEHALSNRSLAKRSSKWELVRNAFLPRALRVGQCETLQRLVTSPAAAAVRSGAWREQPSPPPTPPLSPAGRALQSGLAAARSLFTSLLPAAGVSGPMSPSSRRQRAGTASAACGEPLSVQEVCDSESSPSSSARQLCGARLGSGQRAEPCDQGAQTEVSGETVQDALVMFYEKKQEADWQVLVHGCNTDLGQKRRGLDALQSVHCSSQEGRGTSQSVEQGVQCEVGTLDQGVQCAAQAVDDACQTDVPVPAFTRQHRTYLSEDTVGLLEKHSIPVEPLGSMTVDEHTAPNHKPHPPAVHQATKKRPIIARGRVQADSAPPPGTEHEPPMLAGSLSIGVAGTTDVTEQSRPQSRVGSKDPKHEATEQSRPRSRAGSKDPKYGLPDLQTTRPDAFARSVSMSSDVSPHSPASPPKVARSSRQSSKAVQNAVPSAGSVGHYEPLPHNSLAPLRTDRQPTALGRRV